MAKREKAGIIFVKSARGTLAPASAYDAEAFDRLPPGAEVDVSPRTKRSLPQHRVYWKALGEIVKATEAWPTAEHLHEAVKRDLGYVSVRKNLIGQPYAVTDSIAFDEMSQGEFQIFFDAAMRRIAEATGIDPLAFLDRADVPQQEAA